MHVILPGFHLLTEVLQQRGTIFECLDEAQYRKVDPEHEFHFTSTLLRTTHTILGRVTDPRPQPQICVWQCEVRSKRSLLPLATNTNILHLIKRVYVFTDTAFAEGTSTSLEIPTTQWFSSLRKLDPMRLEALVLPPLVAHGP